MKSSPITGPHSPPNTFGREAIFDHCPAPKAGLPETWGDEESPDADDEELDEFDTEAADEALVDLDGFDEDEPLPEYGDFWIDTDDIDAI